uniref:QLQ domain-containing protein n=1 Tax=Caenorhabditis tropicalis TaxID=1561998 RepID=A0A1I7U7K2_9PELO
MDKKFNISNLLKESDSSEGSEEKHTKSASQSPVPTGSDCSLNDSSDANQDPGSELKETDKKMFDGSIDFNAWAYMSQQIAAQLTQNGINKAGVPPQAPLLNSKLIFHSVFLLQDQSDLI